MCGIEWREIHDYSTGSSSSAGAPVEEEAGGRSFGFPPLGFGTANPPTSPDGPQFCILAHLHFNGVCRGHRRRQLLVDSLSLQLITVNATPSQKSGRSLGPVISVLADWIEAARRLRGDASEG